MSSRVRAWLIGKGNGVNQKTVGQLTDVPHPPVFSLSNRGCDAAGECNLSLSSGTNLAPHQEICSLTKRQSLGIVLTILGRLLISFFSFVEVIPVAGSTVGGKIV